MNTATNLGNWTQYADAPPVGEKAKGQECMLCGRKRGKYVPEWRADHSLTCDTCEEEGYICAARFKGLTVSPGNVILQTEGAWVLPTGNHEWVWIPHAEKM